MLIVKERAYVNEGGRVDGGH